MSNLRRKLTPGNIIQKLRSQLQPGSGATDASAMPPAERDQSPPTAKTLAAPSVTTGGIEGATRDSATCSTEDVQEQRQPISRASSVHPLQPCDDQQEDQLYDAKVGSRDTIQEQLDANIVSVSIQPLTTPEERIEFLLDTAYDIEKERSPEMVQQFERAVYEYIETEGSVSYDYFERSSKNSHTSTDSLPQKPHFKLLSTVCNIFLKSSSNRSSQSDHEPSEDSDLFNEIDAIHGDEEGRADREELKLLRSKLKGGIRRFRHACTLWGVSCFAFETLRQAHLTQDMIRQVTLVLANMDSYIELWDSLREYTPAGIDVYIRGHPSSPSELMLLSLYESVMKYLIHFVCGPWRPRISSETKIVEPVHLNGLHNNILAREDAFMSIYVRCSPIMADVGHSSDEKYEEDISNISYAPPASSVESEVFDFGLPAAGKLSYTPSLTNEWPQTRATDNEFLSEEMEQVLLNFFNVLGQSEDFEGLAIGFTFELLHAWVRQTPAYQTLIDHNACKNKRVLWLSGGPGSGKTEILQAIAARSQADEKMNGSFTAETVSFHFCGSCRAPNNTSLCAIKMLIYHVLENQPQLRHRLRLHNNHIEKRRHKAFGNSNEVFTLSRIFYDLLEDEEFQPTLFIVDSIEELVSPDGNHVELDDLLTLISTSTDISSKIRWLVSFDKDGCGASQKLSERDSDLDLVISPELEVIPLAVQQYAVVKVAEVAKSASYSELLQKEMTRAIQDIPSNFLWVDMVLDSIKTSVTPWNGVNMINDMSAHRPNIQLVYAEKLGRLQKLGNTDWEYCRNVLSTTALAFRPLKVSELEIILGLPQEVDLIVLIKNLLTTFVELCETEVPETYEVHFSRCTAKWFVTQESGSCSLDAMHSHIADGCLRVLLRHFRNKQQPTQEATKQPICDYATIFWLKHLSHVHIEGGPILDMARTVLTDHLLDWLEIVESQNLLPQVLVMIAELNVALKAKARKENGLDIQPLREIILDVMGFLKAHQRWKTTSVENHSEFFGNLENCREFLRNSVLFHESPITTRLRELFPDFPQLTVASATDVGGGTFRNFQVIRHPDWVRGCTFSFDGGIVASASDDRYVRLWDTRTGRFLQMIGGMSGFADLVYAVCISQTGPNDRAIMAACTSDCIKIWEFDTGREVATIDSEEEGYEVAITEPDNNHAENGGEVNKDGDQKPSTDEVQDETNDEDRNGPDGVALAPDDQNDSSKSLHILDINSISLASGGDKLAAAAGFKITVWDVSSLEANAWKDQERPRAYINCVVFSPSAQLLASSANQEITIWDATTGKVKFRLPDFEMDHLEDSSQNVTREGPKIHQEGLPDYEAPSKQDQYSDIGTEQEGRSPSRDESMEHINRGTRESDIAGHVDSIYGLAFSPDDRTLVSGSDDSHVCIWDLVTRKMLAKLQYHGDEANSVAFSPDGTYLATGSKDKTIAIWKRPESGHWAQSNSPLVPAQVLRTGSSVLSVSFSPCGNFLASTESNGELKVWASDDEFVGGSVQTRVRPHRGEHESSKSLNSTQGHSERVESVAIAQKGDVVASADSHGTICLWSGETGAWLHTMKGYHTDPVTALVFSETGSLLVSTSKDNTARVWDVATAGLAHLLSEHEDWVRGAAISPNEKLVATASDDKALRLWNIDRDERPIPHRTFRGHNDWVHQVAFSPDGSYLASASDDGQIMIWNVDGEGDSEKPAWVEDMREACEFGFIRGLTFSKDGSTVIAVDWNGPMALWKFSASGGRPSLLEVDEKSRMRIEHMRFDERDSNILWTEYGLWPFYFDEAAMKKTKNGQLQPTPLPKELTEASLRMTDDEKQIWRGACRKVFLPKEFRPAWTNSSFLVYRSMVVIGCESGQVLFFRFP
ncbi:WD40-repeat-containing domain protein [Pestalotiopsis sp. NC0098]|nr:WD40-repeat-containing domain protein [Pestalotiopsis sp. NC0098]